jgi:predicted Zn finger-like uncharacterized protein
MLTVCPSCATSYDIELASLQPNGRRVRCVRCRNVWRAEPSQADKLLAAANAIAPVRDMVDAAQSFAAETSSDVADSPLGSRGDRDDRPIGHAADANSYAAPDDGSSGGPLDTDQAGEAAGGPIGGVEVDAPPIAPVELDEGQPAIEAEAEPADEIAEDIETYAARRESRAAKGRPWRWPLSRLQSGVLALLIVDAIIVGWRDEFVRIMPQTASFYSMLGLSVNLRGLTFDGVNTATEQQDGVPTIVVDGTIVNESRKTADVPRLKFAVRNASGQEVYSWTAVSPRTSLPPGESVVFRSRLASPPSEAHDILVRFATRHDIISGAH